MKLCLETDDVSGKDADILFKQVNDSCLLGSVHTTNSLCKQKQLIHITSDNGFLTSFNIR